MRFGIVICPKCRKVKAADLSCKTTRCIRCNYIINIKKVKIIFKTDSQQELRQVIGSINAGMSANRFK